MATIAKSAKASMDATTGMLAPQISGKLAGVDIATPATPVYIETDGKLYPCDGTAADKKARCAGFTARAVKAGQPCVCFSVGAIFKYSDELLTPGQLCYLSATPGALSDSTTTGDTVGIAQAIDASNIKITRAI